MQVKVNLIMKTKIRGVYPKLVRTHMTIYTAASLVKLSHCDIHTSDNPNLGSEAAQFHWLEG